MITTKELEHLASLSRIELSDDDKKTLAKEFDSILGYIDQLNRVKTDTDTSARIGAVRNVTRVDVPETISADDRKKLMDEAPDTEGDFIAVTNIFK
ncbi:MAG: Asp-tRNA(Asn)/Glu-tRNA(Gln) amidotransferase subunit GatC [Patescibacteria group bacterium]|nr:Asp-tRNA(Asn)/Glu-tRNA(Gln) amidotransferase subunit GatC [Patescibacteria group bacterium]